MRKIDKNSSHLAGEYFVAAELYRRGYLVGMTIGNAKAIDIFVSKNRRSIPIQVKTIYSKKSNGWTISKDDVQMGIIYIFVNLNGEEGIPDYYLFTAKEAKAKIKTYQTRSILNLNSILSEFKSKWNKL
jgi:predicted AAA+ superfamily ATPase